MAFPTDGDYTYAERYSRTGYKYATPIDESVAADVVTALGDSLEIDTGLTGAISDNILADLITDAGGDPETDAYVDSLIAALTADVTFMTAISEAVSLNEGQLHSADITPAAEIADVVAVTIQLKTLGDDNWNERTMVSVWICDDAEGAVPTVAGTISSVAATTGGLLTQLDENISYQCVTDASGALVLEITEPGTDSYYIGVMLPNGKYIVSTAAAEFTA